MFSYYGSKSKVIDLYPSPRHDRIIEPFAGSARYALKWFDRDVLLIDKYETIIRVWQYLQRCSPADVLRLPDLHRGDNVKDFDLADEERWLIGFCINRGSVTPKNIACDFNSWSSDKRFIADNLFKIKHWRIVCGSYEEAGDDPATWFIDPPYQVGGEHYHCSGMDFPTLAQWCQSRRGQVIVCENTKANWLPFWPIGNMGGAYSATTEAMWSNEVAQLQLTLDTTATS
jgi:site-specific DNA-adenine methylase